MIKKFILKVKNNLPHPSSTLLLCILLFFLSNTTVIYGGRECENSPCSRLNDSTIDKHRRDYFLSSYTALYFSPTGVILPSIFKMNSNYIVEGGFGRFALDRNDKDEDPSWTDTRDIRTLPKVYFITKAITLLSFPWWLFLIFLGKKYIYPRLLGKIALIAFFLVFAGYQALYRIIDYTMGEQISTDKVIAWYLADL